MSLLNCSMVGWGYRCQISVWLSYIPKDVPNLCISSFIPVTFKKIKVRYSIKYYKFQKGIIMWDILVARSWKILRVVSRFAGRLYYSSSAIIRQMAFIRNFFSILFKYFTCTNVSQSICSIAEQCYQILGIFIRRINRYDHFKVCHALNFFKEIKSIAKDICKYATNFNEKTMFCDCKCTDPPIKNKSKCIPRD